MKKNNKYDHDPVNPLPITVTVLDSQKPADYQTYPSGYFKERAWSIYVRVILIQRGKFEIMINLKNYIACPGDLCFVNPEDLSSIRSLDADWKISMIEFYPAILPFSYADTFSVMVLNPLSKGVLAFKPIIENEEPCCESLVHYVLHAVKLEELRPANYLFHIRLTLISLVTQAYESELLINKEQAEKPVDLQKIERYKKVCAYMEENYSSPLTLQDLADLVPCNSQYLCRFFKDIAGTSPIQYLINVRIRKACEMLESTDKSVLDIGMEVGFDNVSYFVRKFKEVKGITPKAYRKKIDTLPKDFSRTPAQAEY